MLTITADFSNHACKDNERVPTPMQIYGKIANFKDFFIKSTICQMKLKFCMVIIWTISFLWNFFRCHSNINCEI